MPAKTSAPAQTRVDAVRNRARLIDAGRAALADGGLDVSVEEIVRRAGFAKGTFFRHFTGKEALVRALLADRLVRLAEIARDVNDTHEPGWEALRTMMERFIDQASPPTARSRNACAASPSTTPRFNPCARRLMRRSAAHWPPLRRRARSGPTSIAPTSRWS